MRTACFNFLQRTGRLFFALILLAFPAPGHAHTPSETFLTLKIERGRITGEWDIALRDLLHALRLDDPSAPAIPADELLLRQQALALDSLQRVRLRADGQVLALHVTDFQTTNHITGEYGIVEFTAGTCHLEPGTWS